MMRSKVLWAALGLALVACTAPNVQQCATNADCPASATCNQGLCESAGSGNVGTPDGGAPTVTLAVSKVGSDASRVTSLPAGIDCGALCTASYAAGAVVTLTAAPAGDAQFSSWSGGCSGESPIVNVKLSVSVVCTANFTSAGKSNLIVAPAGNGTGKVTSAPAGIDCGAACSANFATGTAVTLSAAPDATSGFGGWSGDCTGTAPTATVTLSGNKTCVASFSLLAPVTLTVAKAGAGSGSVASTPAGIDCGKNCSAGFAPNTSVTLTALPDPGSTFAAWSGDCTGTSPSAQVTLGAAKTCTASFDKQITNVGLTVTRAGAGAGSVTSSPAGIDCGAACSASFASGTSVTLTATPAGGSSFAGWSGDCSGSGNTATLTLDGNKGCTATFALSAVALTVTKAGNGGGGVTSSPAGIDCGATCTANFPSGTAVTLTAAPDGTSTFAAWSGDCSGSAPTATVTLSAARTCTASFAKKVLPSLTVAKSGNGTGKVTSSPAGIDCGATCTASFTSGTAVTLTATPDLNSSFAGWSGSGCSGTGGCIVTVDSGKAVAAAFVRVPRVAFVSARSLDGTDTANANYTLNVWRIDLDGTHLTPLTRTTALNASHYDPHWSPDATQVACFSNRKLDGSDATNGTLNIWSVRIDGTALTALTRASAPITDSFFPRWAPNGAAIAFQSSRKLDGSDAANTNNVPNVWTVKPDASALTPVTKVTANAVFNQAPEWSPDSTRLLFTSNLKLDGTNAINLNGTYNVWRINADGTQLAPVTRSTAAGVANFGPKWSPDGTKLVFFSNRKLDGSDALNGTGTYNIWRVNADGSQLTPLTLQTVAGGDCFDPQWSPDGTRVVYSSRRKLDLSDAPAPNHTSNLWRMKADGTQPAALTTATASNADSYTPVFTADGAAVVFTSYRKPNGSDASNPAGNIWRINADGTQLTALTQLTNPNATSFGPQPSP